LAKLLDSDGGLLGSIKIDDSRRIPKRMPILFQGQLSRRGRVRNCGKGGIIAGSGRANGKSTTEEEVLKRIANLIASRTKVGCSAVMN